jgi:hypothetical protein
MSYARGDSQNRTDEPEHEADVPMSAPATDGLGHIDLTVGLEGHLAR